MIVSCDGDDKFVISLRYLGDAWRTREYCEALVIPVNPRSIYRGTSQAEKVRPKMNPFDYLSVFISIVLGLGITQLLAGFVAVVRVRKRIRMYWPVPVQMAAVFLITVQVWWAMFGMRSVRDWTFAGFFVLLMEAVFVYLMAAFITPVPDGDKIIDLRELYFRENRWFFGAILGALLISVLKNVMLTGAIQRGADLDGHIVFATIAVTGLISRGDTVHKILAPASLLAYGAYIALLFVQLPR